MNKLDKTQNFKQLDMSKSEKFELNKNRRDEILKFLVDGEYWITAENARLLLNVNTLSYTRRLLATMAKDGLLSIKSLNFTGGLKRNYYALTERGYNALGIDDEPLKDSGVGFQMAAHNEHLQRLHIIANQTLKVGDYEWFTELQIRRYYKNFASYPDALLTINNQKISIELQRNLPNSLTLSKKMSKVLRDILSGNFTKLVYFCTDNLDKEVLKKQFNKITSVKNSKYESINITDEHRAYFEFYNSDDFTDYINKL